jgi:transposase
LFGEAAVKLSSVLTDLHGVTGRAIMDRLIAGERDPKALAQLARGRARAKISELAAALEGAEFFTAERAALLKTMLDRIDRIDAEITRLSQTIERLLAPWEEQLQQAESMPGWRRRSAEDALAETGPDMTRFPTGAHLASWAGRTRICRRARQDQNGRSRPAGNSPGNRREGKAFRRCSEGHFGGLSVCLLGRFRRSSGCHRDDGPPSRRRPLAGRQTSLSASFPPSHRRYAG